MERTNQLTRAAARLTFCLLACLTVCAGGARAAQTTLVVAADGTGLYKTVQEAINAVPQTTTPDNPAVIRVKAGTYKELIYVQRHVDFIFGGATAFFERCHIHCLRDGYVTAASTPQHEPFGFVFSHCEITGETPAVKTYLGRPWRPYASVTFLDTKMSEVVRTVGWHNWDQPEREKTASYAEYNSAGPGANPKSRAPWSRQLTKEQAHAITLETVLGG